MTVLLCSCGIPAQKRECFSVPDDFVCDIFVTNNGIDYAGVLERLGGKYTLSVTSPESMKGIKISFDGENYEVGLGENKMNLLPEEKFFLRDIIEFFEDSSADSETMCKETDSEYIIEQDNWSVHFSKDG